jgi:LCP family protein required for cell wall assembly
MKSIMSRMKQRKKSDSAVAIFTKPFLAFVLVLIVVLTPVIAVMTSVTDFFDGTIGTDDDIPILQEEVDWPLLIPSDSPFFDAFTNSNKVNILAMGTDRSNLTDTIMLFSIDLDHKHIDVISIPRDTYYYRGPGYNHQAHHKINAVYGGNPVNTALAVSEILMHIPINYYAKISYDGIIDIIDVMGGVPMDVPFHMRYVDPYDKPPLDINIEAGYQILNGEKSVQFLRFRHANENSGYRSYPDEDEGRIRAQQEFVKSALRQCLSLDLPKIAMTAYNNIQSDLKVRDVLYLASQAIGMNSDSIRGYSMPVGRRDYYLHPDPEGIMEMLTEIYSMEFEPEEGEL